MDFETPVGELLLRGSAVYLAVTLIIRVIPKRQTGDLSPNDIIALIVMGNLAASAIIGTSTSAPDLLGMLVIVLLWDYLFNLLEYYFPRWRRIAQDSPTLLIQDGILRHDNLAKEKLTEQELAASLRQHGIENIAQVKRAVMEADGRISIIKKKP